MKKLCPNCHFIGNEKPPFPFADRLSLGIAFLILPIVGLLISAGLGKFSWYYDILLPIVFVILGVLNLSGYYNGLGTCPECGSKEMMPTKYPQAQEIIDENNLSITDKPET